MSFVKVILLASLFNILDSLTSADQDLLLIHIIFLVLMISSPDLSNHVEILTTSTATTDLIGWRTQSLLNGNKLNDSLSKGWDEISFHYENHTGRGFQICPDVNKAPKQFLQSWLRSPALNVTGISRIYVSVEFWMRACHDLEDTICRETFKIYYRHISSNEDISSDTVDLSEEFYFPVDTVAAEVRFLPDQLQENQKLNHEVVSIPLRKLDNVKPEGVYIAIVDEGACVAMAAFHVFYVVCPKVKTNFAQFPETHTGYQDTSLVEVQGNCVDNATPVYSNTLPVYHCTSSGEWKVQTGFCQCKSGFQPDSIRKNCLPCPYGTFKSSDGNEACTPCPEGSVADRFGSTQCWCIRKDYSKHGVDHIRTNLLTNATLVSFGCHSCSQLPSPSRNLTVNISKSGRRQLLWEAPRNFGHCQKIMYCIMCKARKRNPSFPVGAAFHSPSPVVPEDVSDTSWSNESVAFNNRFAMHNACKFLDFAPRRCHIEQLNATVDNLHAFTDYRFTVVAVNGVTVELYPEFMAMLQDPESRSSASDLTTEQQLQIVLRASGASVSFGTKETKPSVIMDLAISLPYQMSVLTHWNPPRFANGEIVFYEVWYWRVSKFPPQASTPRLRSVKPTIVASNSTSFLVQGLSPASNYLLAVRAKNSAGFSALSKPVKFSTSSNDPVSVGTDHPPHPLPTFHSTIYLIVAGVFLFALIVTITLLWFKCKAGRSTKLVDDGQQQSTSATSVPNSFELATTCTASSDEQQRTYVDPFLGLIMPHRFSCETLPCHVTTGEVVGCGEFGEVYRGTLTRSDNGDVRTIVVAVKQLHAQCQPHEQLDFLREAMALQTFQHPNIVKLEAVVTESRPFMIVTELMDHGCLEAFLRAHRQAHKGFPPVVLVRMLRGVACGMEYLSRLQYVHRDLAARNVLINSELMCKVADFGLTRHLDGQESESSCACPIYTTHGGKIAVRWTAPEAVASRQFSQASDVWSFGIFSWEVVTYGEKPYWDLTNQQVLKAVREGYRLPGPEDCPSVIHQLMVSCWQHDRRARPTFSQVLSRLNGMLSHPETLQTMIGASQESDEEVFLVDSIDENAQAVPIVIEDQLHHDYATLQIVSVDAADPVKGRLSLPESLSDDSDTCVPSVSSSLSTLKAMPDETSSLLGTSALPGAESEQSPLIRETEGCYVSEESNYEASSV